MCYQIINMYACLNIAYQNKLVPTLTQADIWQQFFFMKVCVIGKHKELLIC